MASYKRQMSMRLWHCWCRMSVPTRWYGYISLRTGLPLLVCRMYKWLCLKDDNKSIKINILLH